jgi:hypothetical protein
MKQLHITFENGNHFAPEYGSRSRSAKSSAKRHCIAFAIRILCNTDSRVRKQRLPSLYYYFKQRLGICRRLANDLEDFSCCRLTKQRVR